MYSTGYILFQQRIIFLIATLVLMDVSAWPCSDIVYLQALCCNTLHGHHAEVAVPSTLWNRVSSLSVLPVISQGRQVHSRWLALLCGMDFRWRGDCSSGFILTFYIH